MRILFMGTPRLAAAILKPLAEAYEVVGVFTRPDAVRGRGKKLVASPVKELATELGLNVYTPQTLRDTSVQQIVYDLAPDIICVVAYGALLPKEVLSAPKLCCLNVHTSLLPRWRGAAPIQRAILAGDAVTGVSIMRMEEGLDTGPFCKQVQVPCEGLSVDELEGALAAQGSFALLQAIEELGSGTIVWTDQGTDGITYAKKIDKGELALAPAATAADNLARVRASSDAHPSRAMVAGKPLTVLSAQQVDSATVLDPVQELDAGQALFISKRLFLKAADAAFELVEVKPDGKNAMPAKAFAAGIQGVKGKTLTWGS